MATVTLRDVRKAFGAMEVVKGISAEIAHGEFVTLVGPSGCGKSTLLRMISGLEDVSGGRILIGGQDVTWAEPSDRGIAMVFQNYALYPHLTVAQNIGFGLSLARTPKEEIARKVGRAAEILLDARGDEVDKPTVTPRRVRLTRAAVDRLAELTGVPSPAAPMRTTTTRRYDRHSTRRDRRPGAIDQDMRDRRDATTDRRARPPLGLGAAAPVPLLAAGLLDSPTAWMALAASVVLAATTALVVLAVDRFGGRSLGRV